MPSAPIETQSLRDLPARPSELTCRIERTEDRLTVTVHQRSGPGGFLVLWLIAWSAGCVKLTGEFINNPSLFMASIALPFWASWLAVAGYVVWLYFGQERVIIGRNQVAFERWAFVRFSRRTVPLSEILLVRECLSRFTEDDQRLAGIELKTQGIPVRFGFRLPPRERTWLISQLNSVVGSLRSEDRPFSSALETGRSGVESGQAPAEQSRAVGVTLTIEDALASPPSDCSWRREDEFDVISFRQTGRLRIGSILGLFGLNVFWNGGLSVFVLLLAGWDLNLKNAPPQGGEWWFMFVFLIPFEIIGLLMLMSLLVAVMEPFRRTTLRVERDCVGKSTQWPIFRCRRSWPIERLSRIELRTADNSGSRAKIDVGITASCQEYSLTLVSNSNVDVATFDSLTSGEARWMAYVMLTERGEWFSNGTVAIG